MHVYNPNYSPPWRMWYRVGRITNAAGVEIESLATYFDRQVVPNNGDHLYTYIYATGGETSIIFGTALFTDRAIFDLYIDGVLDSAGYDQYAAVAADAHYEVILANPLQIGYHTVELRVNGKNAASTNYRVQVYGMKVR